MSMPIIMLAAFLAMQPVPPVQTVNETPNARGCVEGPHDTSRQRRMAGQSATTSSPGRRAWDAYHHCPGSRLPSSGQDID